MIFDVSFELCGKMDVGLWTLFWKIRNYLFGVLERFDEHFLGNFVSVLKVVNWAMGMPLQTNRWLLGFCNEKILGVGLIFPSLAVAPFKGKGRVFKFC